MEFSRSPDSDHEFFELLRQARKGDSAALGRLIESSRPYLLKVAHDEGDSGLQAKVGESDLVQDACFDAVRSFRQFRGRTSKEMLGWLRQILMFRLSGVRDRYEAEKRAVDAETPLQTDPNDSRTDKFQAPTSSPSEQVEHKEEREVVERALKALSEQERTIIEMRQKAGHAFPEIARLLHLTEESARKRWVRAIQSLQDEVQRLYGHRPS